MLVRFLLLCGAVQASLRATSRRSKPSVARAIELFAAASATNATGRPDECFEPAWEKVPYCRTWPNLPIGMPSFCKQPFMYTKDDTGIVDGPQECINFERPTNCDLHSYCHYCMVYKPEYGLLSAKDQGASLEACQECVLENCCSYYGAYGCEDQCNEQLGKPVEEGGYGPSADVICANNALEHLDSPLKRMLKKKRKFKPAGYGEE
jgi:hypothetical protein